MHKLQFSWFVKFNWTKKNNTLWSILTGVLISRVKMLLFREILGITHCSLLFSSTSSSHFVHFDCQIDTVLIVSRQSTLRGYFYSHSTQVKIRFNPFSSIIDSFAICDCWSRFEPNSIDYLLQSIKARSFFDMVFVLNWLVMINSLTNFENLLLRLYRDDVFVRQIWLLL